MLVLGLATAYTPGMYRDPAEWPKIHEWLVGDAPQPNELAQEDGDALKQQQKRVNDGLAKLRQQLDRAKVDAVIALVSDTGRVFSKVQTPQFCTYLGDSIWGSTRLAELGEKADDDIVTLPCAPDLAAFVQRELVGHRFDMNYSKTLRPMGQPDFGTVAPLVTAAKALTPKLDVPVIPIYVNSHVEPSPSGHRCYAFGQALAEILADRDERVAVLASGGLSHDHHGPRAGWVDYPLDEWMLDHISRGKGKALTPMYDLESDSIHGGTAEIRLWAIAAGTCESAGAKAVRVDYFPSYTLAAGIGFAYWPVPGA